MKTKRILNKITAVVTAVCAINTLCVNLFAYAVSDMINCNMLLMYNDRYHESIMLYDTPLSVTIETSKTDGLAEDVLYCLAEYDNSGRLLDCTQSSFTLLPNEPDILKNINYDFSPNAYTAKIFLWNKETMLPLTDCVTLTQNGNDYYPNNIEQASEIDMSYDISGKINTTTDNDYIKFIPKTTGRYTFTPVSESTITVSLYDQSKALLTSAKETFKYSLKSNKEYYLQLCGSVCDYVLTVKADLPSVSQDFDIYEFDTDTAVYKKSIFNMCNDLYDDNDTDLSKKMYEEYEEILKDDITLHSLPEFLKGHPKETENFDQLVNRYYSSKYNDFTALRNKYIDLIDKYTKNFSDELSTTNINDSSENHDTTNKHPVTDINYPIINFGEDSSDNTDDIDNSTDTDITIEDGEEITNNSGSGGGHSLMGYQTPSFDITEVGADYVKCKTVYPSSGAKGNKLYLIDFNTNNGLTKLINCDDKNNRQNRYYYIRKLKPGGIYLFYISWEIGTDNLSNEQKSIFRFVQMPYDTPEILELYDNGGRISAYLEKEDKQLASDKDFDLWLDRMNQTYDALRDLTGYTPYNGQKIIMASTRDNLNDLFNDVDGMYYGWTTFGYYDNTRIFKHGKAYTKGHMRRLSSDDWGFTSIHELSHTFDHNNWVFDVETLAQLKSYYVCEKLNAKIYEPGRYNNDSKGWYTGKNFYTLLKNDRYIDSYTNSFNKGNYTSEGFATILIDIQKKIGWEPFKKTFRYFSDLSYNQVPDSNGEKLKLFLTKLKDFSGRNVLTYISSKDKKIINNHYQITLDYVSSITPITHVSESGTVSADSGEYSVYKFTPKTSGNYYIYTSPYGESGISNDTYIDVYADNNLTSLIASNDDYDDTRFSKVHIAMTNETPYYIKVRHYKNGRLFAKLNISKDAPIQPLTLDQSQDIITSYGEFALFSFTPSKNGSYVFNVTNYNNSTTTYDTYIKLHENVSMSKQIDGNENKILANLIAGHTYYLQFSGFLMKYAKGRISVTQGQTLQFTKRSDSSFIYVNSPEYLTRIDIVDDICHTDKSDTTIGLQPYLKIFEQENITGENTYYQTHIAWWGEKPEIYEPLSSFYMDIDMYNPTSNTITVSVSNLTYGNEYDILEKYYNGDGVNINIAIPPKEHILLFEMLNSSLLMSHPGTINENNFNWERHRTSTILFNLNVKSGNITISSMAAYDRKNLHLKKNYKNILENSEIIVDAGEIISTLYDRTNESDLYVKYKGIAENQSAWIDANLDFIIDDSLLSGKPLKVNLKDQAYPNGVANPKDWWMTHINPLSDEWNGLIYAMPGNEHHFTYHCNDGGVWNFAYNYHDLRDINKNAKENISRNNPVPYSILKDAESDVKEGYKEHFQGAPDELACGMGAWGATYHYTITLKNDTPYEKNVSYQAKTFDNMIFGYKILDDTKYETKFIPNVGNGEEDWISLKNVIIPPKQTITFEIVTLLGAGHGGTNNRLFLN